MSTGTAANLTELEEVIVDVMGVRMQSLSDLRNRIEELSHLYKREEETFRKQMHFVLEQSECVRNSNETREQYLEAALAKEKSERLKILHLMSQFKKEGAAVIQVMKESLRDVNAKWKVEVDRNAKLTQTLRKFQLGGDNGTSWRSGSDRSASASQQGFPQQQGAAEHNDERLREQIQMLTELVEEEDRIIVELQQRNKHLEHKVGVLTMQRDKLLDVDTQQVVTESFQSEYLQIQQTIRSCDARLQSEPRDAPSEARKALQLKCDALERFTKLLTQRLSVEQRQRLRVEEQSARITAAQDQLVTKLEDRVRELEGSSRQGGQTPRRPVAASNVAGVSSSAMPTAAARGASSSSRQSASLPLTTEAVGADGSVQKNVVEPNECIHAGDDDLDFLPLPRHDDVSVAPPPPAVADAAAVGSSVAIPSLEEQLAMVTKEFHDSVDEWNQSVDVSGRLGQPRDLQRTFVATLEDSLEL